MHLLFENPEPLCILDARAAILAVDFDFRFNAVLLDIRPSKLEHQVRYNSA